MKLLQKLKSNCTGWVEFLTLCFMLVNVSYLYRVVHWQNETSKRGLARDALLKLEVDLLDAESSQRAYLLTNRWNYLDRYQVVTPLLPSDLKAAEIDLKNIQVDLTDFSRLVNLVDVKTSEMAQTIILVNQNKSTEALKLLNTDQGEVETQKIKEVIDEIRTEINSSRN